MRRSRRTFVQPEALERATSVGLALPPFNFVEATASPKAPPRRALSNQNAGGLPQLRSSSAQHTSASVRDVPSSSSGIDCDEILYHTIGQWAAQMNEPSL